MSEWKELYNSGKPQDKIKRLERISDWCYGFATYCNIRNEFYGIIHMLNQVCSIVGEQKMLPNWLWPIVAIIVAEMKDIISAEFGEDALRTIENAK